MTIVDSSGLPISTTVGQYRAHFGLRPTMYRKYGRIRGSSTKTYSRKVR